MKAFLVILLAFFSYLAGNCQIKEIKTGHIKVNYQISVENYAIALRKVAEYAINEALRLGYKLPGIIKFEVIQTNRKCFCTHGKQNKITLEFDSLSSFEPPKKSNTYQIYGMSHEIGHLCQIRTFGINHFKKLYWMSDESREAWAHYFGSMITDSVYKIYGETLWPIPYNYKKDGMERLIITMNSNSDTFKYATEGWYSIGTAIGFCNISVFFKKWKSNGCDQKAFLKTLSSFMGEDKAAQWKEKYFQYFIRKINKPKS
jgi:hypothetical protein